MREKNCGWRIDVFYANEGMMEDVLSSEILDNVFSFRDTELTEDYGLGSLSNFVDLERYHSRNLSYSTRGREYKEGYQATGGIQERRGSSNQLDP